MLKNLYKRGRRPQPQRITFFRRQFIKGLRHAVLFVILFFPCSLSLHPEYKPFYTYYNFLSGTKSLAMGNAFVGVADDLTAVFRNPAGITNFAAPSFYFSYKMDKIDYDYKTQEKDFGTYAQEYNYNFTSKLKNINFLSISVPVVLWDVKWNFALSYYRYFPYGHKGSAKGSLATLSNGKDIKRMNMNFDGSGGIDVLAFTTAFHLMKHVAFGITLQQFFNSGRISHDLLPGYPAGSDFVSTENLEGRNFIFGILFPVYKDIKIGFSYHTRLKDKFHSDFQYREEDGGKREVSTSNDIYIPEKFSLGTGIKLIKFLKLSYEFSRIYWSKGKFADIPFPVKENFSFNQADIINHRLGIESIISLEKVEIYLRTGLSRDRQLFTGADDAKVRVRGYSLGCGLLFSPGIVLELAYMHQRAKWQETGYFDPQTYIGTSYKNNIFSLAFTYHFNTGKKQKTSRNIPKRRF